MKRGHGRYWASTEKVRWSICLLFYFRGKWLRGSHELLMGLAPTILNTTETKTSILSWLTLGLQRANTVPTALPPKMLQARVPAPSGMWQLSTAGALPPRARNEEWFFSPDLWLSGSKEHLRYSVTHEKKPWVFRARFGRLQKLMDMLAACPLRRRSKLACWCLSSNRFREKKDPVFAMALIVPDPIH